MIILVRNRKSEHDHWIVHNRTSIGSKFQLKLTKNFFLNQIYPKKVFLIKNRKSEHHHWILHIRIFLVIKFQTPKSRNSGDSSQICEGLHKLCSLPWLLSVANFSWLIRHPVFLFTPFQPQSVRLCLVTYSSLSSTCMTYRTPCFASSYQIFPTQPAPTEVEDLPGVGKNFKRMWLFSPSLIAANY